MARSSGSVNATSWIERSSPDDVRGQTRRARTDFRNLARTATGLRQGRTAEAPPGGSSQSELHPGACSFGAQTSGAQPIAVNPSLSTENQFLPHAAARARAACAVARALAVGQAGPVQNEPPKPEAPSATATQRGHCTFGTVTSIEVNVSCDKFGIDRACVWPIGAPRRHC